jgi:hypothetical protein
MEPLFETKAKIEIEDCYALSRFCARRSRVASWVFAIFCILEAILWLWLENYTGMVFFVILAILFIMKDKFVAKKQAERIYKANKKFYDIEQATKFYEDKLVRESEISYAEFKYRDLGKIYEERTYFFITQPDKKIICIRKENCPGDFREFIRKVGKENGTYVCCDK